ncbi:MAG: hypothetical protein LBB89_04495 [Treponema sp.]|jgi:hypothetical protein|nr:hypothetical protein [Treponema sp.]
MKINGLKVIKSFYTTLLLGILAVSCGQDPIFYIISKETAPIPPRIPGAPTNMVAFERNYEYLSDPTDPDSELKTATASLFFVASGRLHWYGRRKDPDEQPGWDRKVYGIPQPGGKIIALAVTQDRLYALCLNGDSLTATVKYTGHGLNDDWEKIEGVNEYSLIQSIYADYDTGQLFAGARKNNAATYAILYLDGSTLRILESNTEMLSGAAYRDETYYLCTRGKGIFRVTELGKSSQKVLQLQNIGIGIEEVANPDEESDTDNTSQTIPSLLGRNNNMLFMGMIRLEDKKSIIAIGRNNGILYEILDDDALLEICKKVGENNNAYGDYEELYEKIKEENGGAFSQMSYINRNSSIATGNYATGALALWEEKDGYKKKLVAGRQGTLFSTSYNNGYIEFNLKADGSIDKENSNRLMDTVHDTDRYSTNLGKNPINHLYQVPKEVDSDMIFFASTQTAGLWSYRDRPGNGGWQWNAEN